MSEKIISSKYGSENSEAALQFEKINDQILSSSPILSAQDVQVEFTLRGQKLKAIRGCSLDLYEGETLAIVGESGSEDGGYDGCGRGERLPGRPCGMGDDLPGPPDPV